MQAKKRRNLCRLVFGVGICVAAAIPLRHATWPPEWASEHTVFVRALTLLCGVIAGQMFVSTLVEFLRAFFAAEDAELIEARNRRPQLIIGTIEGVAYPWLMFDVDVKAALALIAAWLTAKSLGNWPGWQAEPLDKHRGRRRLYVYLVANAFQLAWGAVIMVAMRLVK